MNDTSYRVKYVGKRRTKDTLQYFGELCHKNQEQPARTFAAKPLITMAEADADAGTELGALANTGDSGSSPPPPAAD